MIYEVCALVATIILGVIGLEVMLWVRSARKLTDEAKQTVQTLNAHLPYLLGDVQAVTTIVRQTSEQVGGTLNDIAASLDEISKNPLRLVTGLLESIRKVMEIWHGLRKPKKDNL